MRISASASTVRIASSCERAWTPPPRIATTLAPGRASARVATADTAAVRISVIADAFRSARSSPVSPSWSRTAPWCASSPRAGLPGAITISFSDHAEPLAAAVGGHQAHQALRALAVASPAGAAGAARRARASAAPPPSPRCTRPSSAASGPGARRGSSTLMRRAPSSCSCSGGERSSSSASSAGRSWSGRRGPMTTAVTFGWPSSQAIASAAGVVSRSLRDRLERLERVEDATVLQMAVGLGPQRHPRTRRRLLVAAVLPRQPAAGERAERRIAEAFPRARSGGRRSSSSRSSSE